MRVIVRDPGGVGATVKDRRLLAIGEAVYSQVLVLQDQWVREGIFVHVHTLLQPLFFIGTGSILGAGIGGGGT